MVNNKYKALIFDMDGVIIDSEPYWRIAEKECFLPLGYTLRDEDFKFTTGLKTSEVVAYRIREFGLDPNLQSKLERQILDIVKEYIRKEGKRKEGLTELLSWVDSQKIPRIIATSSPEEIVETVLDTLELREYFSNYISAAPLAYGKPHPEVYLKALGSLGIASYEAIIIEDSIQGMIAGKAAKVHTCVIPEHANFDNPKYALADQKFENFGDFLAYIKPLF